MKTRTVWTGADPELLGALGKCRASALPSHALASQPEYVDGPGWAAVLLRKVDGEGAQRVRG
jgi:hypothetical protein